MSNSKSLLHKFLAVDRWNFLFAALRSASSTQQQPEVNSLAVLATLLIGFTPIGLTFLAHSAPNIPPYLPTVGFGVATLLALLLRRKLGLSMKLPKDWRSSMSITHTAVALGCIPAVIVVLFFPDLLTQRQDILTQALQQEPNIGTVRPSFLKIISYLCFVAAWIAVTEEIIYRGLVVSVVRRWNLISSQTHRDIFAGLLSALIFGFAHYPTWGLVPSIALVGLGSGFVIAYIANGEQLAPLVLYHFAFDLLSILVGTYG